MPSVEEKPASPARRRLGFDEWPGAVYAVGDVHGCLAQLERLERQIAEDAAPIAGEKWIVMLGDYVDRGPDSAGVIARLMGEPPAGFRRFCLRGNHEQMLLDFVRDPVDGAYWLEQGGVQTLASYGVDIPAFGPSDPMAAELGALARAHIPAAHLEFMRGLAMTVRLPGWLFVHAGIRPGVPLDDQADTDLIWIRREFLDSGGLPGMRVVHGHTPGREPVVTPARIGIDTHCFKTGRLTALRVTPDGGTAFLATG